MSLLINLRESVPGRAFGPGDTEFDAGRTVFAGVGEPDAVVRPHTVDEVANAVAKAAAAGQAIAVRSGGHGLLPVEDGLVVDLAEFTSIEVGDNGLVSVGGGARWGDIATALAPHGLGISSGDTRDVGVGGLTLGGGIGWLVRVQGLAVDALREVESSPRPARCSRSTPSRTPTSSGRCAAAAATSASSRGSPSRRFRPMGSSAATSCSTRATSPR